MDKIQFLKAKLEKCIELDGKIFRYVTFEIPQKEEHEVYKIFVGDFFRKSCDLPSSRWLTRSPTCGNSSDG